MKNLYSIIVVVLALMPEMAVASGKEKHCGPTEKGGVACDFRIYERGMCLRIEDPKNGRVTPQKCGKGFLVSAPSEGWAVWVVSSMGNDPYYDAFAVHRGEGIVQVVPLQKKALNAIESGSWRAWGGVFYELYVETQLGRVESRSYTIEDWHREKGIKRPQ